MDIILFAAMFVVLLVALGPHHRRTSSLPRAPFGADVDVDRDLDRMLHDMLHDGLGPDLDPSAMAAAPRRGRAVRRFAHDDDPADRDRPTGLGLLRLR